METKWLLTASILSLLLLANAALAQTVATDVLNTVSSILIQFSGIIFILIFVLILLVIGGVWRPSVGGNLLGMIFFLILIGLVFFLPQFITFPDYLTTVPDSFKYWPLPGPAADALQLIGLPREWGYVPAIIYLFILPFAAVYALAWAFINMLGILPQANVNRILALIIAFLTIPLGLFTKMVWALFGFMGIWSLLIFAAMFIGGAFFRGAGVVSKQYSAFSAYSKSKKDAERFEQYAEGKINDLMKKGVPAQAVHSLREVKDDLSGEIRSGGASYDGAKSQFNKIVSDASK
jgi:hypothetical protein